MKQETYRIIREIGSGVFGYVFEAETTDTKRKVAIKRIEKASGVISRQYEILKTLHGHENIINCEVPEYNYFFSKSHNKKQVQNMVFEFIDDSLENFIERSSKMKKVDETKIKKYMYQILKGLSFIHSKRVIHRDLKPQNILLSKKQIIKICDFGSSKMTNMKWNTPYIVSRYYRAPQLIFSITNYKYQIDIWAAGCILAEMYLFTPIFKGENEGDQLYKILGIMGSLSQEEQKQYGVIVPFDSSLIQQLSGFQRKDLSKMFDMVTDKANFIDLLTKMLSYSPSKRISATAALQHPFFKNVRKLEQDGKTTSETTEGFAQ